MLLPSLFKHFHLEVLLAIMHSGVFKFVFQVDFFAQMKVNATNGLKCPVEAHHSLVVIITRLTNGKEK